LLHTIIYVNIYLELASKNKIIHGHSWRAITENII